MSNVLKQDNHPKFMSINTSTHDYIKRKLKEDQIDGNYLTR
jgi:hypothetical protein